MNLTKSLKIKHPIIQAPMAGVTTPEFVAASAEAGVLGSIGAGYFSAEETRKFVRQVKNLTNQPFSVNLFVPEKTIATEEQLQDASKALKPIRDELGVALSNMEYRQSEFENQVHVLIDEGVKVCSFTFGLPDEKTVQLLKENDVFLIGTATNVEEAMLAEQAGMDAVVAQGSEAGGHRGSFYGKITFIPLQNLLVDIVQTVKIPVIAAGGIADKELMEAALNIGAHAVQIGTALLGSEESGAHPLHKQAIWNASKDCTVLTAAFSGKTARGIRNSFTQKMGDAKIAPYPYQNDLTKEIRKESAKQGKSDFMSLWAGESVHLSTGGPLKEIIELFID